MKMKKMTTGTPLSDNYRHTGCADRGKIYVCVVSDTELFKLQRCKDGFYKFMSLMDSEQTIFAPRSFHACLDHCTEKYNVYELDNFADFSLWCDNQADLL